MLVLFMSFSVLHCYIIQFYTYYITNAAYLSKILVISTDRNLNYLHHYFFTTIFTAYLCDTCNGNLSQSIFYSQIVLKFYFFNFLILFFCNKCLILLILINFVTMFVILVLLPWYFNLSFFLHYYKCNMTRLTSQVYICGKWEKRWSYSKCFLQGIFPKFYKINTWISNS